MRYYHYFAALSISLLTSSIAYSAAHTAAERQQRLERINLLLEENFGQNLISTPSNKVAPDPIPLRRLGQPTNNKSHSSRTNQK